LKFLVILLLNAWAGYALLKYWLPDDRLAIFSTMLLNFNPFAFKMLAEGRARELCWFGLFLFTLYFFKSLVQQSLKYPLAWGLWLGLTGIFYWFYALQGLIFIVLYLLLLWCYPPRSLKFLIRNLLIGLSCFALISLPFVLDYFHLGSASHLGDYAEKVEVKLWQDFPLKTIPEQHLDEHSGYFLHGASMMLGEAQPLWVSFSYLGMLLVISAFILARKKILLLFACLALVFYFLALGPYFKVAPARLRGDFARNFPPYSKSDFLTLRGSPIPNPVFMVFYKFCPPFTRQIRPDRYLISAYIFLALLAGLGGAALLGKGKLQSPRLSGIIIAGCLALFLGELLARGYLPLPYMSYQLPEFYTWLAKQERAGIIELPLSSRVIAEKKLSVLMGFTVPGAIVPKSEIYDRINFYQSLHHQRVYGSSISIEGALPGKLLDLPGYECGWQDSPGNTFIAYLGLLARDYKPEDKALLAEEGYSYILLHENPEVPLRERALYQEIKNRLMQTVGKPWAIQDEIWQVGPEQRLRKLYIYGLRR
jgi:hypothetical protein